MSVVETRPYRRTPPEERFWVKVDKNGPVPEADSSLGQCWLWTSTKNEGGYGRFRVTPHEVYAHRYALMLAGADLDGMQVDHRCLVHGCVRPSHLRVVTNKQNQEHRSGGGVDRNNKSGVRGVRWNTHTNRWIAQVRHNGRSYSKSFADFDAACDHVTELRNELFTHNDADRAVA